MSAFSRLLGGIANIVTPAVAISPQVDPLTKAVVTNIGGEIGKSERERKQKQKLETYLAQEGNNMSAFDPVTGNFSFSSGGKVGNINNSGGFFSGVKDFFSEAGGVVRSAFDSGIPQLLGFRPRTATQQPAITTVTNVGAQESQGSGSIQAGMGGLLPTLVSGARSLIKSPLGQTAIGTGAGFGLSMLGSDGRPMRMTRKMKAQARMLLNITGGNLSMTADFLNITEEALVALLLKRFRNDGPVVTLSLIHI